MDICQVAGFHFGAVVVGGLGECRVAVDDGAANATAGEDALALPVGTDIVC